MQADEHGAGGGFVAVGSEAFTLWPFKWLCMYELAQSTYISMERTCYDSHAAVQFTFGLFSFFMCTVCGVHYICMRVCIMCLEALG